MRARVVLMAEERQRGSAVTGLIFPKGGGCLEVDGGLG